MALLEKKLQIINIHAGFCNLPRGKRLQPGIARGPEVSREQDRNWGGFGYSQARHGGGRK